MARSIAAVATGGGDLAAELELVERARDGDHDAFVALYRLHAAPAWRLALALTADGDRAADAVARAFARTLAPSTPGALRTEEPYALRLLTATRQVVVDQGGGSGAGAPLAVPSAPVEASGGHDTRSARGVEVMHAFHQLPERWRTVLWLTEVEGLALAASARVLAIAPGDAEELLVRAEAGLRTQWIRDRRLAGAPLGVAPEDLTRQLQTVLPLPIDLFAITDGRWRAQRVPAAAPLVLLLPLPGGRSLPRWAERALLATTAALIALGITSALVVDNDPDVRRARGDHLAGGPPTTQVHGDASDGRPAVVDDGSDSDGSGVVGMGATATTRGLRSRTAGGTPSPGSSTSSSSTTGSTSPSAVTTTTTPTDGDTDPGLEITAGLGPALTLSLGDQCTGLELGGTPIGCTPDPDAGVTVQGSLVPG